LPEVKSGAAFASRLHLEDLKAVLPQVGFDYRTEGPGQHWLELCPPCKRRTLATAPIGGVVPDPPIITPDGNTYGFDYRVRLSDLYTVTGVR
jgi:hypothetical protein